MEETLMVVKILSEGGSCIMHVLVDGAGQQHFFLDELGA
jgi:hypothetical protein